MYYTNEFIDEIETKVQLDRVMYANIQARNVAKMLASNRAMYKMFGVYWWNVKDALRKHVNNKEWYCGVQDEPLMKELGWHGNEFRTILAAMYYMNDHQVITSDHVWYDKDGNTHNYTLFDPDADC
jgi:hypothetical protein